MKRIFDLILSCMMMPFAIPICLLSAVVIHMECKASPFFWQLRLGRDERQFRLLKLRTMTVDTIDAASHVVGQKQILRVGRVIRAIKIDELPQLWNVLTGNMSLVGPRPGLPVQQELTAARREHKVFTLLPGITGVSQIAGLDMSAPWELARVDATYIGPWRPSRDLAILFQTILGQGRGDAAAKHDLRN